MNPSPNQFIEHTLLRPNLTEGELDVLIDEAKEYQFLGVCVPPFWVKKVSRDLEGTKIKLVTVIGFPLGYQKTEIKVLEIKEAIRDGADELDIVMNVSAFKSGMSWAKIDLAKCIKLIHESGKLAKVIIETALLEKEEIVRASKMVSDAGADFIKTSTGFASRGASKGDIRLMKENVSSLVGIKASGGIKTLQDLMIMVEAGAERVGTSSGVKIMKEYQAKAL